MIGQTLIDMRGRKPAGRDTTALTNNRQRGSLPSNMELSTVEDSVMAYRLSKSIIEEFLRKNFGPLDFRIKFSNDNYVFRLPRRLSENERTALHELRPGDDDSESNSDMDVMHSRALWVPSSSSMGSTNTSMATGIDHELVQERFAALLLESPTISEILQDESRHTITETTAFQRRLGRIISDFAFDLQEELDLERYLPLTRYIKRNSYALSVRIRNIMRQREPQKLNSRYLPDDTTTWSNRKRVESFVKDISADERVTEPGPDMSDDISLDDSLDDNDMDDEDWSTPQPILSELQSVIRISKAFQVFLERYYALFQSGFGYELWDLVNRCSRRNFRHYEICLTYDLSRIAAELEGVPPQDIRIEFVSDRSLLNRFKGLVEYWSGQSWQWWPLMPYQKPLTRLEARLTWKCPCGEERWLEAPLPFAQRLEDIIKKVPASSATATAKGPSSPLVGQPVSNQGSMAPGKQAPPAGNPSQAEVLVGTSLNTSPPQATSSSEPEKLFTFLMVKSWDEYPVSQITVRDMNQQPYINLTCNEFFQQLRTAYKQRRRWVLYYFSVWRFDHCDFYKLQKFAANKFSPDCVDFPHSSNLHYEFQPRRMKSKRPITEHEFYERFYACSTLRSFFHWMPFHHCTQFSTYERDRLDRLPKRVFSLVTAGEGSEEIWGIFAREEPSLLHVLMYNILCLAPVIWFLFMWLFKWKHAGDLQNASVPLTIVLGGLSIFWSVFLASLPLRR